MQYLINKAIASSASILSLGDSRLSILIFHRVLDAYDFMRPDEISDTEFDIKMQLIAQHFTPLSLLDAVEMLENDTLPNRAICVTFDDGYRDNADIAYPILKKWNIPATFFVASGFLDGGRMWNDTVIEAVRGYGNKKLDLSEIDLGVFHCATEQQKEQTAQAVIQQIKHCDPKKRNESVDYLASLVARLPDDLMMCSEQVKQMSENGIEIGGHTVSHPILATLTTEQAEAEISGGKKALENIIQKPVTLFAYPNGKLGQDYLSEHVEIVKKLKFKAAVSTNWGVSNSKSDVYQLNRFTPWDKQSNKFMVRLVRNLTNLG